MIRGVRPALGVLSAVLALSCLSLALAGQHKSWRFSDAATKAEAMAKVRGDAELQGIESSDFLSDEVCFTSNGSCMRVRGLVGSLDGVLLP